jgi:hypothetical protein
MLKNEHEKEIPVGIEANSRWTELNSSRWALWGRAWAELYGELDPAGCAAGCAAG